MAGEKRSQDQEETLLTESVVLVDIEGTTTSISFVKETLFPYVRNNLKTYVEEKWDDAEFKTDFEKLKEQAKKDEEDKVAGFVPIKGATPEEERESLVKNILWQMDADRKTGALKQLQGHMWREAYNSGSVKGHVYEDVPKALESWTADTGRKVYVYSSGSVEAQKLLFGHSKYGDLLKYFSGYFDTSVGMKQEVASYKNILKQIDVEPSNVLFLTDVVKEAQAAKEAGMSAMILLREGNAPLTDEDKAAFTTINSFLDLSFQMSAKRAKLDKPEAEEKKAVPKEAAKSETINEPMETSEDVEMTDVSEARVETKKAVESEKPEKEDVKSGDKITCSESKKGESMEVDGKIESDKKSAEKVDKSASEIAEKDKSEAKTCDKPQTSEKLEKSEEAVGKSTVDETDKAVVSDAAVTVSEKVVKTAEKDNKTTEAETETKASERMEEGTNKPKSKSEKDSEAVENKTEDIAKIPESSNAEPKMETETKSTEATSVANEVKGQAKPEESAKEKVTKTEEIKSEAVSKSEKTTPTEAEETPSKSKDEAKKSEETPVKDVVKENGTSAVTEPEKAKAPTITTMETDDSKQEAKSETKEQAETDKKTENETVAKSEESNDTEIKNKEETKVAANSENEKQEDKSADKSKQDANKESLKEEKVDEVKAATNTAESADKKLNGTTQNGNSAVATTEEKPHRNGLNEESASEKTNVKTKEGTPAQNGEPETSSGASTETIKVKKVVDSTVAEGAGEPDVVPPVVVAATS
ncbi:enolase-phosphatase E1 isoform X1 [Cephus cinctus]|uniref:Enolase-phosphatase E1 n=1 Tax=Cephus cinctus TaxID=211228 RepID=A0AAJ7BPJ6_CEPCN|nr:enolase-phosphatase E1 isoform X1 [Cephus cinctus]